MNLTIVKAVSHLSLLWKFIANPWGRWDLSHQINYKMCPVRSSDLFKIQLGSVKDRTRLTIDPHCSQAIISLQSAGLATG